MSRDSSRTYIHLHSPHHADLLEEFTTPPPTTTSSSHPTTNTTTTTTTSTSSTTIPHEDILIPSHLLPLNPEDEDDVVPDQHATFGITRAMASKAGRERAWRDFEGLGDLVRGVGVGVGDGGDRNGNGNGNGNGGQGTGGRGVGIGIGIGSRV